MKRIIVIIATTFLLAGAAFASGPEVDPKVMDAFNTRFISAREVNWTAGSNFYRATFNCGGDWLNAWYNIKGELLGLTRNISSTQLPLLLQSSLKEKYPGHWITSLVEETGTKKYNYYITLENADQKIILQSKNGNNWQVYRKQNKS